MKKKVVETSAAQKRALFVEAYCGNGGNATEAAKTAGYSAKTAYSAGGRLLKNVEIKAEINRRRGEALAAAEAETGLSVARTLREVARVAYFDVRKLYDEDGRLRPIHTLDDDTAAGLASVEVEEIGVEGVVIGHTKKVKAWDKNSALEKAMKHLGQYEADNSQKPPLGVSIGTLSVGLDFNRVRSRARSAAKP